MKKNFAAACAVLCMLALSACSGGNDAGSEKGGIYTEISASDNSAVTELSDAGELSGAEAASPGVLCGDISNAIMAAVELPSMAEVGADRIGMYLDLSIPEGCDFSMYICGSGGFADEVFVINTDSINVEDVKSAVLKRIEARKKDFEGYNPDEFEKLENYFSAEKNGYFMYAVTCDNSVCESIFDEYVK